MSTYYGWRGQFHHMNAYVSREWETDTTTFYSYSSVICRVHHTPFGDRLDFTSRYDFSPTTSRQLGRFLREYVKGFDSLDVVRELRKELRDAEKNANWQYDTIHMDFCANGVNYEIRLVPFDHKEHIVY